MVRIGQIIRVQCEKCGNSENRYLKAGEVAICKCGGKMK